MDRTAVAQQLLKIARELTEQPREAGSRSDHDKAFGEFDKAFEKYDDYVRALPASTARTDMLRALNAVTKAFTKLDSELFKADKQS